MAKLPKGVAFTARMKPGYERLLTPGAAAFVAQLHRAFEAERQRLLALRAARQKLFDKGALPDFLPGTAAIRAGNWKVAPIPRDLQDRRVEIAGPTDRKTAIAALNSGAKLFMADFEDMTSPTWDNLIQGQANLMDRWTGAMEWIDPATARRYALAGRPAVLAVRPRGLHLNEDHMRVDGKPISGAMFDFGLYFFHNAKTALAKMSGPYFYLPKLESHLEARLWSDVFILAQSLLSLPLGTIKATVLIETLPAAFEMDEIIHELRDHIVGLAYGRSDYIFSVIKTLSNGKTPVLPDDDQFSLATGALAACSDLLVKTCHRRGCLALSAVAAQIPSRKDPAANRVTLSTVKAEAQRQARCGYDGIRVAHADVVPVAMAAFNELMPTPNQHYVAREDVSAGQRELLEIPRGGKSGAGFRGNIRIGIVYLEAWLRGRGAIAIDDVLANTATAEIARAQIWRWLKLGVKLDDGQKITRPVFDLAVKNEMARLREEAGEEAFAKGRFKEAAALFKALTTAKTLEPFLTLSAYRKIL